MDVAMTDPGYIDDDLGALWQRTKAACHKISNAVRWYLFVKLSALGWWVCPEPQRTHLHAIFDVKWEDFKNS